MQNDCTVYRTAEFIGKRWTMLVLLELCKENGIPKRYSVIKRRIEGVTPKLLSLRLKELEREGLIKKKIDASQTPVSCAYQLTKSGNDFIRIIKQMKIWALRWKFSNKLCENKDCSECIIENKKSKK